MYGSTVMDGWAGAVTQKTADILKKLPTYRPMDQPTDRLTDTASSKVACPRLKRKAGGGKWGMEQFKLVSKEKKYEQCLNGKSKD